ncbi:peptide chain release factor 2 [Ruminiclostridium sufflavum DSM 19573]|uniref:Peptide chain release factor 2 n=1 Tax=Ruminiclostridium sufflavum DSM 19573 TaxID=1121337 RepID=A0A318XMP7_9FIRM|nr:peptide chain release factor 2 [Ruminiclostridium sufflavum DSM 19573]
MNDEIAELEHKASEPEFWNDMEKSQRILQKIKTLKSKLDNFEAISTQWEDLITLSDLGLEEQDESVIPEVGEGLEKIKNSLEALRLETLLTGPYDKNNAILTLHAGAGGTEAQDWVQMLLRMFTRWAENKGYQVEILDYLDGDEAGVKSVTIQIIGENAYGYMKSEKGVHRLVRISPFDASGRRHTSFASLDVMPELDESIEIDINPEDIKMDVYRASGAGGQHINKTSSAVRLTHIPTGVVVACQTQRSQFQNKDTAMKMLKAKLFDIKEREQKEKIEDLKGLQMDIAWGSQIRSYVFCPYTLVKDHRTNYENGNVNAVMDGELDGFINAYLSMDKKAVKTD